MNALAAVSAALQQLQGARLVALGRAASLEHFTFREVSGREVFLHLECPWRLSDSSGILVGRADYRRRSATDVTDEDLDAGVIGSTLRDLKNTNIRERNFRRRD
ncbi:MAG: hypothetical protein H0U66_00910 [Gemmatimonadaceae bacterium]|nr:hypothetical protein [Gemmatimonadaceae bacterium]